MQKYSVMEFSSSVAVISGVTIYGVHIWIGMRKETEEKKATWINNSPVSYYPPLTSRPWTGSVMHITKSCVIGTSSISV